MLLFTFLHRASGRILGILLFTMVMVLVGESSAGAAPPIPAAQAVKGNPRLTARGEIVLLIQGGDEKVGTINDQNAQVDYFTTALGFVERRTLFRFGPKEGIHAIAAALAPDQPLGLALASTRPGVVLVPMSGHGGQNGSFYLGDQQLRMDWLGAQLRRIHHLSPASVIVIVADQCFAGQYGALVKTLEDEGVPLVVFAAALKGQLAPSMPRDRLLKYFEEVSPEIRAARPTLVRALSGGANAPYGVISTLFLAALVAAPDPTGDGLDIAEVTGFIRKTYDLVINKFDAAHAFLPDIAVFGTSHAQQKERATRLVRKSYSVGVCIDPGDATVTGEERAYAELRDLAQGAIAAAKRALGADVPARFDVHELRDDHHPDGTLACDADVQRATYDAWEVVKRKKDGSFTVALTDVQAEYRVEGEQDPPLDKAKAEARASDAVKRFACPLGTCAAAPPPPPAIVRRGYILIADVSGSNTASDPEKKGRIDGARYLAEQVRESERLDGVPPGPMAFEVFSDKPQVIERNGSPWIGPTQQDLKVALEDYAKAVSDGGGTNIGAALEAAHTLAASRPDVQSWAIWLFSDGAATVGVVDNVQLAALAKAKLGGVATLSTMMLIGADEKETNRRGLEQMTRSVVDAVGKSGGSVPVRVHEPAQKWLAGIDAIASVATRSGSITRSAIEKSADGCHPEQGALVCESVIVLGGQRQINLATSTLGLPGGPVRVRVTNPALGGDLDVTLQPDVERDQSDRGTAAIAITRGRDRVAAKVKSNVDLVGPTRVTFRFEKGGQP